MALGVDGTPVYCVRRPDRLCRATADTEAMDRPTSRLDRFAGRRTCCPMLFEGACATAGQVKPFSYAEWRGRDGRAAQDSRRFRVSTLSRWPRLRWDKCTARRYGTAGGRVKVQRPNIRQQIADDFEVLEQSPASSTATPLSAVAPLSGHSTRVPPDDSAGAQYDARRTT